MKFIKKKYTKFIVFVFVIVLLIIVIINYFINKSNNYGGYNPFSFQKKYLEGWATNSSYQAGSPWPHYGGLDNYHTRISPYVGYTGLNVAWTYKNNNNIMNSSPVIDNAGNIYFGTPDGYLYCLTSSGSLKWKSTTIMVTINSSPAIDSNGTIYIGSTDKKLYAFNNDGSQKWVFTTNGNISINSPIIDSNGHIIIGSYDGYLYCVKNDGTLVWSYKAGLQVLTTAAIDSNGNIWFGSDTTIYVLNNTGIFLASYKTNETILTCISIDENEIVYFSSRNGTLYACNLISNPTNNYTINVVWSYETNVKGDYRNAIGPDGTVYFSYQTIYALKAPSDNSKIGVLINSFNTTDYDLNNITPKPTPTYKSQAPPTIDANGNIYFSAVSTYYVFDKNLNVINSYPISGVNPTFKVNLVSPVIDKNGTVYVGTLSGLLIAFKPTTNPTTSMTSQPFTTNPTTSMTSQPFTTNPTTSMTSQPFTTNPTTSMTSQPFTTNPTTSMTSQPFTTNPTTSMTSQPFTTNPTTSMTSQPFTTNPTTSMTSQPFTTYPTTAITTPLKTTPYSNLKYPVHGSVIPIYHIKLLTQNKNPSTFTSNDVIGNLHLFSTENSSELLPKCFTAPPGGIFGYLQFTDNFLNYNKFGKKYLPAITSLKMYFLYEDCYRNENAILTDFSNFEFMNILYYNKSNVNFILKQNNKTERYFINGYKKPRPFEPNCMCVQKPSNKSYYFVREKV